MRRWMGAGAAAMGLLAGGAFAQEAPQEAASCATVRIADLGWTDIALTNATAMLLLDALGYQAESTLLGLDVTYMALREGQMDVFLGNWRPVQNEQFAPFFDQGWVEVLGQNLEGAKFTLAVPAYVAEAGVRDFADLDAHGDRFGRRIYAIEPGSNQTLVEAIEADRHGLGDWDLVETSEAGMLAQVSRLVPRGEWIVFLGWQPHPMNLDYDMVYLSGGDIEYGPDYGGATVHTIARPGFAQDCPNLARFFANLVFDVDWENAGMALIMGDEGLEPEAAARAMIAADPSVLDRWLEGVVTREGAPGAEAARAALGL
jgi:glycine betaine/proline transport system substrate-binding protein